MAKTLYGYNDPNMGWVFYETQQVSHTHKITISSNWPPDTSAGAVTCLHPIIIETGPFPYCATCKTKMKPSGYVVA